MLIVQGHQHFCIGGRAEGVALLFQGVAKFNVVINFAVEHHGIPIEVVHGLVGGGAQIDNREAAVAQANLSAGVNPMPGAVGTTMGNNIRHRLQAMAVEQRGIFSYQAGNPTHKVHILGVRNLAKT